MNYNKEIVIKSVISSLKYKYDYLNKYNGKKDEDVFNELITKHHIYIKEVVSYTTRGMRDGETEGIEHYFISPNKVKEILEKESVLAYTKIGEYEYFATVEGLNHSNLYIIDPKGIKYLRKSSPDTPVKIIYISIPDDIREERCKTRSDYETKFKDRYNAENDQFTEFEECKAWDCYIENIDFEIALSNLLVYIFKNFIDKNNCLFLVAARTGSGKDTLIQEAKNLINGV